MGGDEFLLLLPEIAETKDAAIVAKRIMRALGAPMQAGGHELFITPSIGIAVYPEDGEDIETLLRNADLAMYFAKRTGRNTFQHYDASMNATALKRLTMENQLRGAIDRGEFSLHYQPQMDLKTGRVCGMEALLRWSNAELGDVPPAGVHPRGRRVGPDQRDRGLGAARGLRAGERLAACRPAAGQDGGQRFRRSARTA